MADKLTPAAGEASGPLPGRGAITRADLIQAIVLASCQNAARLDRVPIETAAINPSYEAIRQALPARLYAENEEALNRILKWVLQRAELGRRAPTEQIDLSAFEGGES